MKLKNFDEKIVYYYLILTYLWYFLGAQYILAPLVGWFLTSRLFYKLWRRDSDVNIPLGVWIWVLGSLVVLIAQIVALADNGYSLFKILSTIVFQWARGYGLFAIFPLLGCLNIRPQVWYRIASIICIQSLMALPIFFLGHMAQIGGYVSPLSILGRQGEINYAVSFYRKSSENEGMRLSLFAPWAPGLGFIACSFFFLLREESNKLIRFIAMVGCVAMVAASVSRLGIITLPVSIVTTYLVTSLRKPVAQFVLAAEVLLAGITAPILIEQLHKVKNEVNAQRADSSRVRGILADIGLYRWRTEAMWWGHGLQEKGPKMTAFMPIGTHHTWVAMLFTNGLIGLCGILIPYLIGFIYFIVNAGTSRVSRVCFSTLLVMGMYSFGETWGSLAYLLMPSLAIIGKGFQNK